MKNNLNLSNFTANISNIDNSIHLKSLLFNIKVNFTHSINLKDNTLSEYSQNYA